MALAALVCAAEETVLDSQSAPGRCPFCGGAVMATDVERRRGLCCLTVRIRVARRYSCASCSKRLVLYPSYFPPS